MEEILKALENQKECTAISGLNLLLTMVNLLLQKPYPNVLRRPLEEEYDFIVIGGGSGGATAASRLSENPKWKVLLLEAGGEEPYITRVPGVIKTDGMFNTAVEWDFLTEPHPDYCGGKPCTYGRGKMLGGCDGHNGMWYLKGNRQLYDDFLDLGLEGWSFDEVWRYYERRDGARELQDDGLEVDMSVERFCYIDKNVDIIMEAYKEFGIIHPDLNGNILEGYKTTSKNGTRISVNRLFLEKIRPRRKNLHVYTETFASKVIIDPITKTATGVEAYITEGGKKEKIVVKARREVFVCAGVINSPKILQLSGIGPKQLLEKYDIPVIKELKVGSNFMNHPVLNAIKLKLTTTSTVPADCEAIRSDIQNYITNQAGPLASTGPFNSYLLTNSSRSTKEFPDLLFAFNPSLDDKDIKDPKAFTCYCNKMTLGVMAGVTKSLGEVKIKSKDWEVPPAIYLGIDEYDKEIICEGQVMATKLANCKTFKDHGIIADNTPDPRCADKEYGSYEYWKCAMQGKLDLWLHGMGTCSMGPKVDPTAVVDNKCRVYGIQGLRVADASIFRNVTNANINAAAIMIGEKCTEFAIVENLL